MSHEPAPKNLNVRVLARSVDQLSGEQALSQFERLADEVRAGAVVPVLSWQASAQERSGPAGELQPWLRLQVQVAVPLVCQRCLSGVEVPVTVDRWFRFVDSEAVALQEDDDCDEDVLTMASQCNLHNLIEDEVLMAMPLVPRHEDCPQPVQFSVMYPGFEQVVPDKPNPFAVLGGLTVRRKG